MQEKIFEILESNRISSRGPNWEKDIREKKSVEGIFAKSETIDFHFNKGQKQVMGEQMGDDMCHV